MMIGPRRRRDLTGSSFSSSCTTASYNPRWSDGSSTLSHSPALLSPQRPTIRSDRHLMLPIVPAAWSPIPSISSPRAALRDLCLPRQEPRPPANILNRSYLGSCSPSLAKFSRTTTSQHISASTSTTTLPSPAIQSATFLHPTMTHLTVNGLRSNHYHHHSRHAR